MNWVQKWHRTHLRQVAINAHLEAGLANQANREAMRRKMWEGAEEAARKYNWKG